METDANCQSSSTILSRMVSVYCSWEYIVSMSDSIKTGINLLQVRMEMILKKHLYKNLTPINLNSKISYDQTPATQGKFI